MADDTKTAVAGANGKATATIQPWKQQHWSLTQVSVEMTSTSSGLSCTLRKNGYLVTPMVPYGGVADGSPLDVLPSDVVTVEWTGANAGDVGKVYYTYDVIPYA